MRALLLATPLLLAAGPASDLGNWERRPGLWRVGGSIELLSGGADDRKMVEEQNRRAAKDRDEPMCLTPEKAPLPFAALWEESKTRICDARQIRRDGPRVFGTLECTIGDQTEVTQMNGHYTPDRGRLEMTATARGPDGKQLNRTRTILETERLGDCPEE